MPRTLSPLDHDLLRLLRKNGREPFVRLANQLGTSEGTVRARIKRLSDDGVIRQFTIRTGGANLRALIEVVTDTNVNTSKLSGRISGWRGVEVVYEVSGDEDILVIAEADGTEELNELIEKIRKLPDVRSTRSRLILREV